MDFCQIHKKYPGEASCRNLPLASDPEGLCILHSQNQRKDPEAFKKAFLDRLAKAESEYDLRAVFFSESFSLYSFLESLELTKSINFSRAIFSKAADFSGVKFIDANFHNANFTNAFFRDAIFTDRANFDLARFINADFCQATFKKVAYFMDSEFIMAANFEATRFNTAFFSYGTFNIANFSRAIFEEIGGFYKVRFIQKTNFSGANFLGRVSFIFVNSDRKSFDGDFTNLEFENKSIVRFKDLQLSQVQFAGTDLRHVEFDHVTWASWWRTMVYDEILLHRRRWAYITYVLKHGGSWGKRNYVEEEETEEGVETRKPSYADFAKVERLYRQLKINYEEERDFKRVGDFHYGEMEMHRRGSFWRQWLPSWYNFYRVLSGYGERPFRAFIVLIALVFILALVLSWTNISWEGLKDKAGQVVGYWDSLIYLLQKATFQRPEWPKPVSFWSNLWAMLGTIFIPGQAALFILALRNRLGRRR